jgi:hypothetical protein
MDKRVHRIKTDFGLSDYYKFYNEVYKNAHNKVEKEMYSIVLIEFLEAIRDQISLHNKAYILPHHLGTIELLKSKPEVVMDDEGNIKGLPLDYKATKELREATGDNTKKVYHFNEATGGYIIKAAYRKYYAKFKNKSIYALHMNRTLTRNIKKAITQDLIDVAYIPLKFKK